MAAKNRDSKIDVNAVREHYTINSINKYLLIENSKILYDILSKELPPERINGIVSLMLAIRSTSADEEIENALVKKMCN